MSQIVTAVTVTNLTGSSPSDQIRSKKRVMKEYLDFSEIWCLMSVQEHWMLDGDIKVWSGYSWTGLRGIKVCVKVAWRYGVYLKRTFSGALFFLQMETLASTQTDIHALTSFKILFHLLHKHLIFSSACCICIFTTKVTVLHCLIFDWYSVLTHF